MKPLTEIVLAELRRSPFGYDAFTVHRRLSVSNPSLKIEQVYGALQALQKRKTPVVYHTRPHTWVALKEI